jgi:hypothetical protein
MLSIPAREQNGSATEVFVCGGIVVHVADMVQAQKSAGSLGPTANYPCRCCGVHKGDLDDLAQCDVCALRKTDCTRRGVRARKSRQETNRAGLARDPSFLESSQVAIDVTTQIPPEPCHAETLGMGSLLLTNLATDLTSTGLLELNRSIAGIQLPRGWTRPGAIALSATETIGLSAVDIRHAIQLLPFALLHLRTNIKFTRLRQTTQQRMRARLRPNATERACVNEWSQEAIACACAVAQANHETALQDRECSLDEEVDLHTHGKGPLETLHRSITTSRASMSDFWPGVLAGRPNAHTGLHHPEAAHLFGLVSNLDAGPFELRHAAIRATAANTSGRNVSQELMERQNIRETFRAISKGYPAREPWGIPPDALELMRQDEVFARLLHPDAASRTTFYGANDARNRYTSDSLLTHRYECRGHVATAGGGMDHTDQRHEQYESVRFHHRRAGADVVYSAATAGQHYYKTSTGHIVRVIAILFTEGAPAGSRVRAQVEWGKRGQLQANTGCYTLKFAAKRTPSENIIAVEDVREAVHVVQYIRENVRARRGSGDANAVLLENRFFQSRPVVSRSESTIDMTKLGYHYYA